ncbi:class I SAM-dependent methyltransferase [Thalassobius sp. Cn5-15]|uniref:class I SAM-dependent methyltransferase n=1 Tax=Thalassobius sp. Cn5-15 TaxID=2917763 RepID=UPI001EF1C85E|nr:class I SAM-dependent methyltransferase [Thalassobius sp. Cn5-15]MCG7494690.1 class I SAM-dependent methyltransferase [Thalassobius sp. Cn5-15]
MTAQQTARFWDKIADGYAKSDIADMAAYEYTLDRSSSYIRAEDEVLELGCGTGMTAVRLAPHAGHFIGSDVSEGMLSHCRMRAAEAGLDNLSFTQAMVGDQTFEGRQFDVVMAHSLLHLLPDLDLRLDDIAKLVKPGGLFISKTGCLGEGLSPKSLAIRAVLPLMQLLGKAPYVNSLSIARLEDLVTAAGFEIIETGNDPHGAPPVRYLVARRIGG